MTIRGGNKMWRHTFIVVGQGRFPIDMLRYDQCFPNSEYDSSQIADSVRHIGKRIVTLSAYTSLKNWQPEFERWKSFLWKIEKHEVYKM